jgi:hypothetical protein
MRLGQQAAIEMRKTIADISSIIAMLMALVTKGSIRKTHLFVLIQSKGGNACRSQPRWHSSQRQSQS